MTQAPRKEDFSDEIAKLQVLMKLTGINWLHPRIAKWLSMCGFRDKYDMPLVAYQALSQKLETVWLEEFTPLERLDRVNALQEEERMKTVHADVNQRKLDAG